MITADKDNELIDQFMYGDKYAFITPYDVDLEATMKVMGWIIKELSSQMTVEKGSYGAFSTADGWICNFLSDLEIGTTGTGPDMMTACYNALVKYVKNEKETNSERDL
jgi:hypothetical protein